MILVSAIGFGSYGVWSRLIGPEFGVFYQGWVRSALVLAILLPIAYFTKSFKPVTSADKKWIWITVIFGALTQAPLYYAFNNMDIGTATLVFYASFLITSYVIGKMFLNEDITAVKIVSLILAFSGLVLIFGLSLAKFSLLALLLAVLNGVASGGEVSTTKKSTQKFSSLQIGIYVWAGILISHLPLSIAFGERQVPPAFDITWLSMVTFAIIGLIAFWLVIEGYKYVDASIGGLLGLMEIISGVLFGIMFFNEKLIISVVIGGGLILLAAMLPDLMTIISRQKAKRLI